MPHLRLLIGGTLLVASFSASAAMVEEIFDMPIAVKDHYGKEVNQTMKVTIFHDDEATAPQPFLVIDHGRSSSNLNIGRSRYLNQSKYFVSKGFVVVVPTRVGYGETGGPDIDDAESCNRPKYESVFRITSAQSEAAIAFAKTKPYVDPTKGIVAGQSYGGMTAIATAAKNIPGVVGAINFAGGAGGNAAKSPKNPCRPDMIEDEFARFGKTSKIPTLWLYSENDLYFGTEKPKEWMDEFVKKGGTAEFVKLPTNGWDGHTIFSKDLSAWQPAVERFIKTVGL